MSYNNCRFCKKPSFDSDDDMVKYGVRHHAHYKCYLDAGKSLDALPDWKVARFPFFLLKERDLLDQVEARFKANGFKP